MNQPVSTNDRETMQKLVADARARIADCKKEQARVLATYRTHVEKKKINDLRHAISRKK
ncbi:MAG: hypothetical protein ACOYUK_04315 [Patescibacteria group bacterium]